MKLFFCPKCEDVVRLKGQTRCCECGSSWGRYLDDDLHAEVGGDAIPMAFENSSFLSALRSRPQSGRGQRFDAFVIAEECETVGNASRGPVLAELTLVVVDPKLNGCFTEGCSNGAVVIVRLWGREQCNLCARCLSQKVQSGEWVLCDGDRATLRVNLQRRNGSPPLSPMKLWFARHLDGASGDEREGDQDGGDS